MRSYLLCQEPGPAIAESFRLAGLGQRVSVGREDGTWYVRILNQEAEP